MFSIQTYIKICDFYARPIRKEQFFRGNIEKKTQSMRKNSGVIYLLATKFQ